MSDVGRDFGPPRAGRLLKAFATVGLVLTPSEDTKTRQVQGGGE